MSKNKNWFIVNASNVLIIVYLYKLKIYEINYKIPTFYDIFFIAVLELPISTLSINRLSKCKMYERCKHFSLNKAF